MSARTIYVRWSDDGQHIRKWSWSEFDLAERLIAETVTVSDPKAQALADALRAIAWLRPVGNENTAVNARALVKKMETLALSALAAWEAKP